jgi:hypothetical protein
MNQDKKFTAMGDRLDEIFREQDMSQAKFASPHGNI